MDCQNRLIEIIKRSRWPSSNDILNHNDAKTPIFGNRRLWRKTYTLGYYFNEQKI